MNSDLLFAGYGMPPNSDEFKKRLSDAVYVNVRCFAVDIKDCVCEQIPNSKRWFNRGAVWAREQTIKEVLGVIEMLRENEANNSPLEARWTSSEIANALEERFKE
jgi:hypothetical protein